MITERHLEALKRLLPAPHEFKIGDGGYIAHRLLIGTHTGPGFGEGSVRTNETATPWRLCEPGSEACDHVYGEIRRALLKQEDVYGVTVRSDRTGQHYIELDANDGSWAWQEIKADRSDLLTALLEANALYWEAKEDVK